MRLGFADCVFDPDTREVVRGGRVVPLSPKAFQLLEILIRDRPKAMSKQELHRELWPSTFVADANLANLVADLRGALGDDAHRPRIIRTVQRFGYAFAADARPLAAAPPGAGGRSATFKLIWDDREIALSEGENVLGRDESSVVWIDVYSVSRRHARIVLSGDRATLEDLGSKNGTFLRGARVTSPISVEDGDEIRIGTVSMTFRRFEPGGATRTAPTT